MPFRAAVVREGLYYLTTKRAIRIPAPPTMWNHGNYVASLSQLGRWLAEHAEEAGATILPETPAARLLVTDGRVRGVRTGDKGRGRNGEQLQEAVRARQARGPAADDRDADLDALVLVVELALDELAPRVDRRLVCGRDHAPVRRRHPLSRPSAPSRPR